MSRLWRISSNLARVERRIALSGSRIGIVVSLLAALTIWSTESFTQSASEATEIIRSLAPIEGQTVAPGYGGPRREAVQIEEATVYVDLGRSISLEVYFDFDSAGITPQAKMQLAALGQALVSPELVPHRYLIAGHTDATGSDDYNLGLSQRRARAVHDYLVSAFAIDPHRLMDVGFGRRRLKRPETPYAAVNRRVEVLLVVQ